MPGTLLLDDLRDSVQNQLGDYAQGLISSAQQAVAPVAAAIPTAPQAPEVDPNAILQELQQHAAAAAQAAQEQAQPALQVLGGAQQAAGGAVTQLGQTKDQIEQQLQQHAQDVVSGAQDIGQQLQDHVNTVLGSTTPQAPTGVQALPKPQPPTLGAPAQPAAATGADVLGGPPAADTTPPDRSMSLQDYARAAAVRAGVDPNIFVAQIQQESGFNPQAKSGAGALGIAQFMPATAAGMNVDPTDPYAALDAAAKMDAQNLAKYGGDYSKTLAAYNAGGGAVDQYGGVPPYKETQTYVSTILNNARQSGGPAIAPPQQTTAQARSTDLGYTDISQFGDKQLSNDEAYAACGPAAAVRFAERFGRNPTLREATDLAKQVGWTASGGMAGIQSEQQLLKNMGVDTHVVAPDWDAIAKEAQTGNPVTISTPGHYFFADGYNPESGAFHVGQSGLDLRQGSEWMTPAQMESLMGKAQGALFADNPNVPAKGAAGAPTALGGTTGAQNAPITLGGPAPARAPLYADTNQPATPIQSAQDVLGQAGEAVGGAASALGTAAQQALAQAQDINRIQPGTEALKAATPVLGGAAQSASTAVNQVAQDVQNAAQGVLGAAQDVNRLTPGTTAVNAAAPVLGAAASDLGTAARGAADTAGQTLGGSADQVRQQVQDTIDSLPANATVAQARSAIGDTLDQLGPRALDIAGNLPLPMGGTVADLQAGVQAVRGATSDLATLADQAHQQIVDAAQTPAGQALIQAGVQNATDPSLLPAGSRALYQQVSGAKNQWIEQNNPVRDVPVVGGLVSGIAQQLSDPLALATFGPTVGVGESAAAAVTGRLAPAASQFVTQVAGKLTSGAIVGGIQNGLAAAEAPGATPQSVGEAVLTGAGLGAAVDVGGAAFRPVIANVGRMVLDRAGALADVGLNALERVSPAQDVLATTRRAGESSEDYLARLASEAPARTPEPAPPEVTPPTNPYDLPRSAPEPNAAPLSQDQVLSHLDYLDQLHTQNDARIAELQNRLAAGPSGRGDYSGTVVRPPWAVGWTNQGLEELARRNNLNPYEANWWERGNFVPGTGEMREDVGQSGIAGGPRYSGTKLTQQSSTEMRAELARLQADQTQLDAAHDSIWEHAGQGGDVYAPAAPEGLPFEGGLDAGAAQAARGPASADAEAAGGRSEARPGVPGAPGAAEPTPRAELAQSELTTPTAAPLPPERPPASLPTGAEPGQPVEGLPGVTVRTVRAGEPPLSPGPRPPIASAAGVPEDARSVYAMTSNGSLEQAATQAQADMQRLQSVRNGLASDTGPRYDNAGNPMNSAARDWDLAHQARAGGTPVPNVETPATPSGARPISMTTPEQVARLRLQDFPPEVQQTIQDAAKATDWANAQRRGVIPDRVANNLADELANSTSLNQLIDQHTPGQAFNTEQLRAIRNAIGGQGVKVSDLAAAISGGDKSLETAQQFLTEGDKLQRLVQLAEGGRAEAGRAMRAFQALSTLQNLAPEQATAEIASRLARNPDQLAQAVANYQQLVDSGADPIKLAAFWNSFKAPPVTGMDWFKALRYNSMISGVPTIERIGITGALENLYGMAREAGSALARGKTGEAAAIAKGAWLGFLKGGQNARDTLIHGINEDQALAGGFPRGIAGRVNGPLASGPIRGPIAQRAAQALELPGRLHSALQDVTQGTAYGMRMYQRAAQDADRLKLSGDAAAQHIAEFVNNGPLTQRGRAAMQDAATFSQRAAMRGDMGTFGSALTNLQQAGPIGHLVLPFARVAYNVGVRGIDRSPLGLLGTAVDVARTGGRYARANNQAAVDALGLRGVRPFNERLTDNAIGTLLTGAAYLEAMQGNVTGAGPSDVSQRDLLQSQGWQPYSLRIGGNYVPYRVLGPWAIPLALAASGAEAQTYAKAGQGPDDPLSLLGDAARRSGEFAANETYLRDIGNIMRGIQQPDRYGNQFISDMASSVLPYGSLLGNVAQATSGVQRQTSSPTGTPVQQAALNTLTSRIPGLANQLPARTDVLGRPMSTRMGAGILPETPTSNPGDAVLSELTSHGVAVPAQNKVATAGQAEAQLTPGQQRAVQTYAGTLIQQNVTQLMADPSYRAASNADQAAMLARAVSAGRSAAEREMLSRLPADQLKPARQVTITVPVAQRVPLPVP